MVFLTTQSLGGIEPLLHVSVAGTLAILREVQGLFEALDLRRILAVQVLDVHPHEFQVQTLHTVAVLPRGVPACFGLNDLEIWELGAERHHGLEGFGSDITGLLLEFLGNLDLLVHEVHVVTVLSQRIHVVLLHRSALSVGGSGFCCFPHRQLDYTKCFGRILQFNA